MTVQLKKTTIGLCCKFRILKFEKHKSPYRLDCWEPAPTAKHAVWHPRCFAPQIDKLVTEAKKITKRKYPGRRACVKFVAEP